LYVCESLNFVLVVISKEVLLREVSDDNLIRAREHGVLGETGKVAFTLDAKSMLAFECRSACAVYSPSITVARGLIQLHADPNASASDIGLSDKPDRATPREGTLVPDLAPGTDSDVRRRAGGRGRGECDRDGDVGKATELVRFEVGVDRVL
jgi:hypothetical protein